MDSSLSQIILVALFVGMASGAIGAFIILKRMALVGDALSHVALPGVALALAYGIDPFLGVIVFLLGAAVIMWWLEANTRLPSDALVGLLFTTSLAIGILTIPDTEILESLFGEFSQLSALSFLFIISAAVALLVLTLLYTGKFVFISVSPDLAKVNGVGDWYRLFLYLVFACVVALGIKLVGTLLMGALVIIPASIAKNSSYSMRQYIGFSTGLGGLISVGGAFLGHAFGFLPGPTIILLGVFIFIFSLCFSPR